MFRALLRASEAESAVEPADAPAPVAAAAPGPPPDGPVPAPERKRGGRREGRLHQPDDLAALRLGRTQQLLHKERGRTGQLAKVLVPDFVKDVAAKGFR